MNHGGRAERRGTEEGATKAERQEGAQRGNTYLMEKHSYMNEQLCANDELVSLQNGGILSQAV
jgi:hypothetical protein